MPFWLFYPRRLSRRLLTQSWKAIFRPSDAWWPLRPASRLSPSFLSKTVAEKSHHFFTFVSLKYISVELLVTGMLCHSKVWSRVWTHRCNVNMNPYISVYLCLSVSFLLIVFQSFSAVPAFSSFILVLLSSQTGSSEGRLCHFTLFSRAVCLNFVLLSLSHYLRWSFYPLCLCISHF